MFIAILIGLFAVYVTATVLNFYSRKKMFSAIPTRVLLVDQFFLLARFFPQRLKVLLGHRMSLTDNGTEAIFKYPELCVKAGGDKHAPILATLSMFRSNNTMNGRVILNDAEYVRQACISKRQVVDKPTKGYKMLDIYGSNIVTTDGPEWVKHRTLCNPAFSENNNRMVVASTLELVDDLFVKWDRNIKNDNGKVNISQDATSLALGIIGMAGFGENMKGMFAETERQDGDMPTSDISTTTPTLRQCMSVLSTHLFLRLMLPKFVFGLPFIPKKLKWYGKCFDQFETHLRRLIASCTTDIQNNVRRSDVLALLVRGYLGDKQDTEQLGGMNSVDENDADSRDSFAGVAAEGSKLTLQEVVADSYLFFFAGHETTAHSLANALALLAIHPEEQKKLRDEVTEAVGTDVPTYADIPKLGYAKCVGLESLRLIPPAPFIPKKTDQGVTLNSPLSGEVKIPPRTIINVNVYALHHNPQYWSDPEQFKPSRFDSRYTNPVEPSHKAAFAAFSLGQRSCIGRYFAELELTVALARMVQCFEFSLPEGVTGEQILAWKPVLTATPIKDIQLIVRRR